MGHPNDNELKGITPRMFSSVFELISTTGADMEFDLKVSMLQIYLEKIGDLLNPNKQNLQIRQSQRSGI